MRIIRNYVMMIKDSRNLERMPTPLNSSRTLRAVRRRETVRRRRRSPAPAAGLPRRSRWRRTGDLRRLREYFDGIHQEIRRKVQRATRPETRASEVHRLAATADVYRARVADVVERYSVRVRLWPLAVIGCTAPAYRLNVQLL